MTNILKNFIFFIFILTISIGFLYPNDDLKKVQSYYDKALKEFEKANYDKAIEFLDQGLKKSPENQSLLYEKGLAFYLKRDFKQSIFIFRDLIAKNFNEPNCFVLLGNSLDYEDKLDSARLIYNEGISKFPSNGALYYQLGNSFVGRGPMADAVAQWETGVQNDPGYPENYFQLAKYYARVSDKLWALFYGEIFMNISENPDKSKEISNLLYNTYKNGLFAEKDSSYEVKFTSIKIIYNQDSVKKDLPFPVIYQKTIKTAFDESKLLEINDFSIANLIEIRREFIDIWFLNKYDQKFSNIIFDKHKKMLDEGVFESYNYWLFREANPEEFKKWIVKKENLNSFKKFNNWYVDNPETMSMGHFFTRFMYDYMLNNLEFKQK